MKRFVAGAVLLTAIATAGHAAVVYVDADATSGAHDGTSWADAYTDLSSALAEPPITGDEVWVADGTYKPTTADPDPRKAAFQLAVNVPVYGGFDGTEISRSERDWVANVTILSGDIGTAGDPSDNCRHVVLGAAAAILDGFTVSDGNASGGGLLVDNCGGGMFVDNVANVVVANCVFSGNSASSEGGAVYVYGNILTTFADCRFLGNTAAGGAFAFGGAISGLRITLTDCAFLGNSATERGGAVCAGYHDFTRCAFSGNTAACGGAVYVSYEGTMSGCSFSGNAATASGGGAHIMGSVVQYTASVTNCTFSRNSAPVGAGIVGVDNSPPPPDPQLPPPIVNIANSIVWNNSGSELSLEAGTVTYSDVYGGFTGTGNIDADPQFVDALAGDLHLKAGSPCIDAADGDLAPATDIDGKPRVDDPDTTNTGVGATSGITWADMGACEFDPVTRYSVSGNVALTGALTDPTGVTIRLMSGGMEADSEVLSGAAYLLEAPDGIYTVLLDLQSSPSLVFTVTSPRPNAVVVNGGAVAVDVAAEVVDLSTTYTITPSVSAGNGTIAPGTPQTVFAGGSVTFVITPDPGNTVGDVLVDGISVGAPTVYQFTEVSADATIAVTFQSPPSGGGDSGGCSATGDLAGPLALLLPLGVILLVRRRSTARG